MSPLSGLAAKPVPGGEKAWVPAFAGMSGGGGATAPAARRKAIVVGFAGGGGSSIAIAAALGVHPDAALNHWPSAIATHQANFPGTAHYCADIFDTDCREVLPGEEIGLAWFSPDCRHFSKAKGGTPVSARVRGLAWAVIPWAKLRRPDVIMLENVDEFTTWGPLVAGEDGLLRPDPARRGQTFERFVRRLRQCGYAVEWRGGSSAADFGAPTIRRRFLLIARRDGHPIVWPTPTHAPRASAKARGLKPYRAAAEVIDFTRPCPSIFLSKDEARAIGVKRPLEEATLRRIAKGLYRYTIASADPFIVPVTHAGDDRTSDVREPLRTMTTSPRGEFALVAPVISGLAHGEHGERPGSRSRDVRDPLTTIHAQGGNHALASAIMVRTDMSGAKLAGANSAEDPLRTFTSAGGLALVAANLTTFQENITGSDPRDPLGTVMAGAPRHGLVAVNLTVFRGDSEGRDLRDGLPAVTANSFIKRPGGAAPLGLAAAFMEQANTDMVGHDARDPLSTMVQKGCTQRVITAQLSHAYTSNTAGGEADPRKPLKTVMAGGNHAYLLESVLSSDQPMAVSFAGGGRDAELRAFLVKYYGEGDAADLADPLGTVTARSRFGLVMVSGVAFRIVDIGMRMLDPETELAAAMGVPRGYFAGVRLPDRKGRPAPLTKTAITKLVGNMVQTDWAAAHVRANCAGLPWWGQAREMAA